MTSQKHSDKARTRETIGMV